MMHFGIEQLKAKTPLVMRALGSALIGSATILATKEVIAGRVSGTVAAAVVGIVGKFLTECFGEPTTVSGTVNGVPTQVTQPTPPPNEPELVVTHNDNGEVPSL